MSRNFIIILILVIFAGVVLWFSVKKVVPKKNEVEAGVPEIEIVTPESFESKVLDQVKSYRQFGALPVTVATTEQGKINPFVP